MTKCNICQLVNHWATDCPDKDFSVVAWLVNEKVLHQNNDELKFLVSETYGVRPF